MSNTAEAESDSSPNSVTWRWLWWLFISLLLYIVSTGPIIMLEERNIIASGGLTQQVIECVYGPLGWVVKRTPLQKPLGMYWHLWAPGLFNSKGDLNIPYK
jgi:hypothetical protein